MIDIKDFINRKLFFPKTLTIDKPGIFISKTSRKYGSTHSQKRIIHFYEDSFSNLQKAATNKIGDKAKKLFYKLGKEQVSRYLLLSKAKKPPRIMLPTVVEYILNVWQSSGVSLAEDFTFNKSTGELHLRGSDNIFCRKSKMPEYFAGAMDATMNFLTQKKVRIKIMCAKCPDKCSIVATPTRQQFVIYSKDLKPSPQYDLNNFPRYIFGTRGFSSFRDFLKFRKIDLGSNKKLVFNKHVIVPAEIGWLNMTAQHFERQGLSDVFRDSLKHSCKKIFRDIKTDIKDEKSLLAMLAAFGHGIPTIANKNNQTTIRFVHAPFSNYGHEYQAIEISGYLSVLYGRDINLIDIKTKKNPYTAEFVYC